MKRGHFEGNKEVENEVREAAFAATHAGALKILDQKFQQALVEQAAKIRASLNPDDRKNLA